jgi:hypothetical protein
MANNKKDRDLGKPPMNPPKEKADPDVFDDPSRGEETVHVAIDPVRIP